MPYHRVMVRSRKIDRTINVHETGSVVRSNVSWIDLQSFKVNSLVGCALFSKFLGHNPLLVELDELN